VLATVDVRHLLRLAAAGAAHALRAVADTAAVALMFALSILSVAAGSYSPFLYFRF
jgi:hypothetical protein